MKYKGAHQLKHCSTYKKISHADRLHILYLFAIHQVSVAQISQEKGVKVNSIRNIIKAYESSGRTNKKRYFRADSDKKSAFARQDCSKSVSCSLDSSKKSFAAQGGFREVEDVCKEDKQLFQKSNVRIITEAGSMIQKVVAKEAGIKLPLPPALSASQVKPRPRGTRCSLKLYVCQGPSTRLKEDSKLNQYKDHSKDQEYEKEFLYNDSDQAYPYSEDLVGEAEDEAEAIALNIEAYENGKPVTQIFTGGLHMFDKYISRKKKGYEPSSDPSLFNEPQSRAVPTKVLKTLPQDEGMLLKLILASVGQRKITSHEWQSSELKL